MTKLKEMNDSTVKSVEEAAEEAAAKVVKGATEATKAVQSPLSLSPSPVPYMPRAPATTMPGPLLAAPPP